MMLTERVQRELNNNQALQAKMKTLIHDEEDILIGRRSTDGQPEFVRQSKKTGKRTYINKQEQEWILQQLQSRFGSVSLKILEKNQALLETLLDNYQEYDPVRIMQTLPKTYQYAQEYCMKNGLLQPPSSSRIRFKGSEKPFSDQDLKHTTTFGLNVRSKGEALIAEVLYYYTELVFFYEKKLTLKDEFGRPVDVYPDFTIIQPQEDPVFWEHKGMMSDPEYMKMDQWKMNLYFQNGIYMPKNLIITCDGPDGSTDMQSFVKLINGYFGGSRPN